MSSPERAPAPPLPPPPDRGRTFTGHRRVRLGDVGVDGRVRLDALARYLQDLSADDSADVEVEGVQSWVVRRTVIELHRPGRYLEPLELTTWCSGIGSHYAERRITIRGERGAHVEAATLWVHTELSSGRPRRVPEAFHAVYAEAAQGRRLSPRRHHGDPPATVARRPWPLRRTDFDLLGHVNNAAYWEALEDERVARGMVAPLRAEMEHPRAVEPGEEVELLVDEAEAHRGRLRVWVAGAAGVAASGTAVQRSTT